LAGVVFDVVDMYRCHRSTFLRATPAKRLFGKPVTFDCLPSWRPIPSAPLDFGFRTMALILIDV
jgi:hypothetical protein